MVLGSLACGPRGADCGNAVDVRCPEGGCECASGPNEGMSCDVDDLQGADGCDTLCAFCEVDGAGGPPSVLLGL